MGDVIYLVLTVSYGYQDGFICVRDWSGKLEVGMVFSGRRTWNGKTDPKGKAQSIFI